MKCVGHIFAAGGLLVQMSVLCLFAPPCFAGMEAEWWDSLPALTQINFSSATVEFGAADGRQFVLTRADYSFHGALQPVSTGQPAQATAAGFITSDGRKVTTKDPNCGAEGDNSPHTLALDGLPLKDQCKPCSTISAAETANDMLWLGTRFDGEYGASPAEGIVVQSLKDGALAAKLSRENGLTGNLVRLIRKDPFTGNLWAVSNAGINEISPAAKIIFSGYMYEDFTPDDGSSSVFLSSVPAASNPLAVLEREIGVPRTKDYYAAALTIPKDIWSCLNLSEDFPSPPCEAKYDNETDKNFLPRQFNALLPFLFEAAASNVEARLSASVGRLCRFNDRRVYDFFSRSERTPARLQYDPTGFYAKTCLHKYESLGLSLPLDNKQRADTLVDKITLTLAKIRAAGASDKAYYDYITNPARGKLPIDSINDDTQALIDLGDMRGIELINDYFLAAKGSDADADLFERLQASLYPYDKLAPAMMAGLEKIIGARASSGCQYFDMTYKQDQPSRFNAGYLPAILAALENAVPEKVPHQPEQTTWVRNACRTAFLSQVKNPAVKAEFFRKYYPRLTPASQKLAADLLRGI